MGSESRLFYRHEFSHSLKLRAFGKSISTILFRCSITLAPWYFLSEKGGDLFKEKAVFFSSRGKHRSKKHEATDLNIWSSLLISLPRPSLGGSKLEK